MSISAKFPYQYEQCPAERGTCSQLQFVTAVDDGPSSVVLTPALTNSPYTTQINIYRNKHITVFTLFKSSDTAYVFFTRI
jgi:hypothetical protein